MRLLRGREILVAVRELIAWGDEVLMCVAYANVGGVHLIAKELGDLGKRGGRASLLATTQLSRTTGPALSLAASHGVDTKTLNPHRGTFHSKIYMAMNRGHTGAQLVLGSANLTTGLDGLNIEAAVSVDDDVARSELLRSTWNEATSLWTDPRSKPWRPLAASPLLGTWEPSLLRMVRAVAPVGTTIETLVRPSDNRILRYDPDGVVVETDTSRAKRGAGVGEKVPAEMFAIVWDYLQSTGAVEAQYAQAQNGLRVMRSSFVIAVIARFPGVTKDPRSAKTRLVLDPRA